MDRFSFFFAFYGLILGLAVTELLGGFAGAVRMRVLRRLEPQTALLALLTFVAICATWIDAWKTLRSISLDFAGLWAPVLLATAYYLAAAVVFPRDVAEYEDLGRYYADRKRFVIAMLLIAELLVTYTFWGVAAGMLARTPAVFWLYFLPYNLMIKSAFIALMFVDRRRVNVALLATLIFLFLVPYWGTNWIAASISRLYGYQI